MIERYRNFREESYPGYKAHFAEISQQQQPRVLFIACSDSRVVPNLILSGVPGDIFECRIVGNIVPSYGSAFGGVSATIEYAVTVLKVQAIIICGHSDCGAVKALQANTHSEELRVVSQWLQNADAAKRVMNATPPSDETTPLLGLTRENVIAQMQNAQTHPAVAAALRNGLELLGWVYDLASGTIECYDDASKRFVPLESISQ